MDYLQGFNDGYEKALNQLESSRLSISVELDGKEVAKNIHEEITELRDREERQRQIFSAK